MRIRVLGGGWYGCHIATALIRDGHDVVLHEKSHQLFNGASGGNPARLHLGFHYPRSRVTRVLCQEHHEEFMKQYGGLTSMVPVNVYAIAQDESLMDFGTYKQVLRGEVEFVSVDYPAELGLKNVEGAVLTGERHIVIDQARKMYANKLSGHVEFQVKHNDHDPLKFDWTIDCTFCANGAANVERYEPCVTGLLKGPTDRAITIMDGPFPSLYPWNEATGLNSLTSAKFTPFGRCKTRAEADEILNSLSMGQIAKRIGEMQEQLAFYWPESRDLYEPVDYRLTIRAQPKSGADARFVDVSVPAKGQMIVRAGKIDAVIHAERLVKEVLQC